MRLHLSFALAGIASIAGCASTGPEAHDTPGTVVPFGVVLNIYCPIRLLPLTHPESLGHDFPNPPRWHTSEADALIVLGRRAGLGLAATVRRYPRPTTDDWPFTEFAPPKPGDLELAAVIEVSEPCTVIPGLRAAAFEDGTLICFLIDTRGLTLQERGMSRATTMGLDLSREEFLSGIDQIARSTPDDGNGVIVFAAR